MTRLYSLLVCVLLCCCARADARRLGEISSKLVLSDSEDAIPEQFIVRFGKGVRETEVKQKAAEVARQTGGEVLWIYKHVFKGFALTGVPQSNLNSMLDSDDIESIEQVRVWIGSYYLGSTIIR